MPSRVLSGPAFGQASYDSDFYSWALEQADLLRSRRFADADWEHIAEELESLAKSDRRALASHVGTIIEHLLKLRASQDREPRRQWRVSVRHARRAVNKLLEDSPSLRRELPAIILDEAEDARRNVAELLECDESLLAGSFDASDVLDAALPD